MSRIGKKPVAIPNGMQVSVTGQTVKVKGSKGELSVTLPEEVLLEQTADAIIVSPREDTKRARSMWGLSRTLIDNIVQGTTNGYSKTLEIQGVGYRAQMKGKDLQLNLGFSHEVVHSIPKGIDIQVTKPTEIVVSGIDKQLVGQIAAEIRSYRPPEPYQGKGVRYQGEYIFRKEGKKK